MDENFKTALKMYETNYTHEQLLDFLKNGNVIEKQTAALQIENINSVNEAEIIVSNLTGQDGKIREAVSHKICEFCQNTKTIKYFLEPKFYKTYLDAITDINGNICRNIISAIKNFKSDTRFCNEFCPKLEQLTIELVKIVEQYDFQDGKYKVNKDAFKLYWCLETINILWDKIDKDSLKIIIKHVININEYTIREKAAKILSNDFIDSDLITYRKLLKNDKNYYVNRY